MIPSIDESLKHLLHQAIAPGFDVAISFDLPDPAWSAFLTQPTVNLFLFEVKEINNHLINQLPPSMQETGYRRVAREFVRIDLYYLVSCWAITTYQQHVLLSHLVNTFQQTPVLPAEFMPPQLPSSSSRVQLRIAQEEHPPSIIDLWSAIGSTLHPALRLVVEVFSETTPAGGVSKPETSQFSRKDDFSPLDQTTALERNPQFVSAGASFPIAFHQISGRLRRQNHPNGEYKIILRETGQEFLPDREGVFRITRLQEGEYHLEILVNGRLEKSHVLRVPSSFIEIVG